jgi:hypothetical protein
VLIVIGSVLLLGQFVDDLGRAIPLVVGLSLLGLFLVKRAYGLLVAGCIVTGVGAGVLLASVASGVPSGSMVLLALGAGFAAIWPLSILFRLPERSAWGLVPGGILAIIGVAQWTELRLEIGSWWPLLLIGIGVIVIVRGVWRRGAA